MVKDILDEIIARKRVDVAARRKAVPIDALMSSCGDGKAAPSMAQALSASATGIIAEFKRRSPSRGWIHADADVTTVAADYARAGATAMSVLGDTPYFGGSLSDIAAARAAATALPILCKDFIIDEYQLYEARTAGASAVLLIAAALPHEDCARLAECAHSLGLEVLLELHSDDELPYAQIPVEMIGINNRNLGTFHTDPRHALRMIASLPTDRLLVAESGIGDAATCRRLRAAGYRGFLIGEHFMKNPSPGAALSRFIAELGESQEE